METIILVKSSTCSPLRNFKSFIQDVLDKHKLDVNHSDISWNSFSKLLVTYYVFHPEASTATTTKTLYMIFVSTNLSITLCICVYVCSSDYPNKVNLFDQSLTK